MKRLLATFLIGIFLAGMPAQVFAVEEDGIISTKKKVEIPSGMEGEWENFTARYGDAFTSVEWDFGCACVRELYGYYDTGRGELKSKADVEALARKFLSENAGLFKIDTSALKVTRVLQFGPWNVEYIQTYNGIPVYRGEVGITLSSNSVIKSLGNNFYPGINISTRPKITKKKAIERVEREINKSREIESTELYIVPKSKNGGLDYRLAWRVYVKGAYFFVDAVNGEIIHKEYTVVANEGVSSEDSAVNGEVVSEDTVTSTPAQTEGPSSSSSKSPSTILVGLVALAIAAILIIWRYRK